MTTQLTITSPVSIGRNIDEMIRVLDGGLDPRLVELVKIRASPINGCARCLEMHATDARALGEEQDRLDLVSARSEAGCFSEPERAAVAWCEALTLAITTINAWNRLRNLNFSRVE